MPGLFPVTTVSLPTEKECFTSWDAFSDIYRKIRHKLTNKESYWLIYLENPEVDKVSELIGLAV